MLTAEQDAEKEGHNQKVICTAMIIAITLLTRERKGGKDVTDVQDAQQMTVVLVMHVKT